MLKNVFYTSSSDMMETKEISVLSQSGGSEIIAIVLTAYMVITYVEQLNPEANAWTELTIITKQPASLDSSINTEKKKKKKKKRKEEEKKKKKTRTRIRRMGKKT